VLIVGCGSIGRRHARVLAGMGVSDLRACDPLLEQREALHAETPRAQLYTSYEAALAGRPDTVFVCTPTKMHLPMASAALRAGAHVFCEKPLALSSEGIDDLDGLARQVRRQVMVGLCFRYHAGLLRARRLLDEGRIGRLVSGRFMVGEYLPGVRPDYRNLFSAHYSGAFDLIHEVDLALWYAGQPAREVFCLSGAYSDIGITAPDIAEILIGFADRCLAGIHLDFFQQPRRRQTELIGTEGTVIVEFAAWDHCTVSHYQANRDAWEHEEIATQRDDMFRDEDLHFLLSVVGGMPVECGIAEGRKSVEVIERCTSM